MANQQPTIPVTVAGVYIHPNQKVPVVFLADSKRAEVIAIFVGLLEAQAIVLAWRNLAAPRPLTIDLLKAIIIEDLKCTIEKVVVHSVKQSTFLANIYLRDHNGAVQVRDARPSDAIALALRAQAPLEIGEQLLNRSAFERDNTRALLELLEQEAKSTESVLAEFKEEWLTPQAEEADDEEE